MLITLIIDNLLSLALQITVFPSALPLMPVRLVHSCPLNPIALKTAFKLTTVCILQYPLAWLLSVDKKTFINQHIYNSLNAKTVWDSSFPASFIQVYPSLTFSIHKFTLSIHFSSLDFSLIIRPIFKYQYSMTILSPLFANRSIIHPLTNDQYKMFNIFSIRHLWSSSYLITIQDNQRRRCGNQSYIL